ncbi:hypothetical protein SAMN06298216_4440 [Spirosomataceae bacterium TFI 002]|nr:hypothetical protein SAMN06298216_4440 [Spirosomataceae bacterium TFI 002]
MLKSNLKEYEYLEKEVAEIKSCITRYIGYIVSTFAIVIFIGEYMISQTDKPEYVVDFRPFSLTIILAGLVVITLLFEIIWYKFKSHNRHVGYLQLLSQEISHHKIVGKAPTQYDLNDSEQKLFNGVYYVYCTDSLEKCRNSGEIHGFKLIMSRYNNAGSLISKKEVEKISKSVRFTFYISKNYFKSVIEPNKIADNKKLDVNFFEKITEPQFNASNEMYWTRFKLGLINLFCYLFNRDKAFSHRAQKLYKNYINVGWLYPRKLLQIAVLIIAGLLVFFFWVFFQYFSIKWASSPSITAILHLFILSIVLNRWITKYLYQHQDMLCGVGSIDYYCWAFFYYRIEFLNSRGICPQFYSSSFVRYYKSIVLSEVAQAHYNGDAYKDSCTSYVECLKSGQALTADLLPFHENVKSYGQSKEET